MRSQGWISDTVPVCVPPIPFLCILIFPAEAAVEDVFDEEMKILKQIERTGKDIIRIKVFEPNCCSCKFHFLTLSMWTTLRVLFMIAIRALRRMTTLKSRNAPKRTIPRYLGVLCWISLHPSCSILPGSNMFQKRDLKELVRLWKECLSFSSQAESFVTLITL